MPLYNFSCGQCGATIKKLMPVDRFRSTGILPCPCGGEARHRPGAATSQTMEVLDNGIAPRRVERLSEAERIFRERAAAHDQKYKENLEGDE